MATSYNQKQPNIVSDAQNDPDTLPFKSLESPVVLSVKFLSRPDNLSLRSSDRAVATGL